MTKGRFPPAFVRPSTIVVSRGTPFGTPLTTRWDDAFRAGPGGMTEASVLERGNPGEQDRSFSGLELEVLLETPPDVTIPVLGVLEAGKFDKPDVLLCTARCTAMPDG